jgi:hypothetical protein
MRWISSISLAVALAFAWGCSSTPASNDRDYPSITHRNFLPDIVVPPNSLPPASVAQKL